ncbi:MAG: response regulator receiver protein [Caulobacter sp.]|jgi:CheY-like chemotaxis protein|nr:response regulator receiver protein [Caulobacter sp.]
MTTTSHLRDASTDTQASAVAASAHLVDVIPLPATLQVLLVEDDDADAYLIERALAGNPRVGAIIRARDGVEALELVDARRMKPDLAIIDLHMPRKDGFALLSELAARVVVEFPSVILTSSKRGADALRSRKRGATLFVTKPNSLEKLTAALDRVVATV